MKVKVYNNNKYPFEQEFKGVKIRIEAKKYIEMEYDEAVDFKSSYSPVLVDGDGQPLPISFKMLSLDADDVRAAKEEIANMNNNERGNNKTFVCHMCNKEFMTKNGLIRHVKNRHMDDLVDDDTRDEIIDMEVSDD